MDSRPFADADYETWALSLFRLDLSAEEFAARFAHEHVVFNFDRFQYRT